MKSETIVSTNKEWNDFRPTITVITPLYNREDTILRAMNSLAKQTMTDFEYIVVDDGSTDNSASVVLDFMEKTHIPMMVIQKSNGGVHTARNIAIKAARGGYYCCLDSDDEFLPDGLNILWTAWESIPWSQKLDYFEVKARCKDQNGNEVGPRFPELINERPWDEVKEYYESISAEHVGLRRLDIMKNNLWPEPDDVTFVGENIVWYKLREEYKTWLINDCVQIYHMEGDQHLDVNLGKNKRTVMFCNNMYWNITYTLNHWGLYGRNHKMKALFSRELMRSVLKIKQHRIPAIELEDSSDRRISVVLRVPAYFAGIIYCTKRLK